MLKRLAFIVGFALAVTNARAQEPPPRDVKGWQGATWGMNEKEVLDAFKGKVVPLEKPVRHPRLDQTARLTIPKYEVDGGVYDVRFAFDKDGGLNLVMLLSPRGSETSYDGLSKLLIERYGVPTSQNRSLTKRQALWRLPSTTIDLEFERMAGVEIVSVKYSPPSPERDKL